MWRRRARGIGASGCVLLLCGLLLGGCAAQRAPVVSREPPPPERGPRVHEVARGDTLYAIAWRYDTTVEELARLNNLGPPYLIRVGQRLVLDAAAARTLERQPAPGEGAAVVARPVPAPGLVTGSAASAAPVGAAPRRPDARAPPAPLARASPPPAPAQPPPGSAPPPAAGTADWRWPVEGRVTRQYDSGRRFKGINIQSKPGAAVRAAAPGEVVYAGDGLRGYGQLIIVKHDAAHLSAYAHNRVMKVREGDRVSGGQTIGEVGGDAANPGRLYFEIRREGKPIDPTRLLPAQ
ncbi:MAG: peptidoglycan DD-metalloendopeptidase family protein [Pseudomonadota bacterium]